MAFCPRMKKPQKIVLPKGYIDPNETAVIELPNSFGSRSTIVVTEDMILKGNDPKLLPIPRLPGPPTQQVMPPPRKHPPPPFMPKTSNAVITSANPARPLNSYAQFNPPLHSSILEDNRRYVQGILPAPPAAPAVPVAVKSGCSGSSTSCKPPGKYLSSSSSEDFVNLDLAEKTEWEALQKDLEEFQRARRKLLRSTTALAKSGIDNFAGGCNTVTSQGIQASSERPVQRGMRRKRESDEDDSEDAQSDEQCGCSSASSQTDRPRRRPRTQ